jgi:hypothetical protein
MKKKEHENPTIFKSLCREIEFSVGHRAPGATGAFLRDAEFA